MAGTEWEYMFHVVDFSSPADVRANLNDLNRLGEARWEAILSFTISTADGPSPIILLKRPQSN
jgi:hypothetical protein